MLRRLMVLELIRFTVAVGLLPIACLPAAADDAALRQQAEAALLKAARFYQGEVAIRGGYVYYYSPDLQQRWGEGVATADQIWVQPPGTPTVGMAYLRAYEATGNKLFLEATREAGAALLYGQLESGGWTNAIDFNPRGQRVAQYRNGNGRGRNYSTLDDGITQSAIQFLAQLDRALEFKDETVHEGAMIALDALLQAQFTNGAFPQVWIGPVPPVQVVEASYPEYDWRTEGRMKNYWNAYTLNDGLAGTVSDTLLEAHAIYNDPRYLNALRWLGDFLLLAQMPDPQPAWAQQYSADMHPIWARRFEPPAIAGSESQDVLETLLKIYSATKDERYLEPFPRAIEYLKGSRLPDGRLARFYELKTNKPLYMTRSGDEYTLTHDDSRLPDHYGWKGPSRLDEIERQYKQLRSGDAAAEDGPSLDELRDRTREIIAALDEQGRWVSVYRGERVVGQPPFREGQEYLSSEVFSRNVETLSAYLKSSR